jgi:hypothetical protein
MTPEQEILEQAIEALQRETNARVIRGDFEKTRNNNKPDAELWIQLPKGVNKKFLVEIKRTLTEATATRLVRERAENLQNHFREEIFGPAGMRVIFTLHRNSLIGRYKETDNVKKLLSLLPLRRKHPVRLYQLHLCYMIILGDHKPNAVACQIKS